MCLAVVVQASKTLSAPKSAPPTASRLRLSPALADGVPLPGGLRLWTIWQAAPSGPPLAAVPELPVLHPPHFQNLGTCTSAQPLQAPPPCCALGDEHPRRCRPPYFSTLTPEHAAVSNQSPAAVGNCTAGVANAASRPHADRDAADGIAQCARAKSGFPTLCSSAQK